MRSRSKYLILTTDYLIPIGIILLAIAGYFISFHTSLFAINQINCTLDYQPCPTGSVVSELDKSLGNNLISLDTDHIKSRLLSGEYTIRSVEFSRIFPNTLDVTLLSTYPVIALQLSDNSNQWIAIDERMRVITVVNTDPNVPTVTLDSTPPFRLGKEISDTNVVEALQLALEISRELRSVIMIHLDVDSTVTLKLSSGVTALLTTTRSRSEQIYTLQSILADQDMIQDHKLVDVRFSRPVLKSY